MSDLSEEKGTSIANIIITFAAFVLTVAAFAYAMFVIPQKIKLLADLNVELPVITLFVIQFQKIIMGALLLTGFGNILFFFTNKNSTIPSAICLVIALIIFGSMYLGMELPFYKVQELLIK